MEQVTQVLSSLEANFFLSHNIHMKCTLLFPYGNELINLRHQLHSYPTALFAFDRRELCADQQDLRGPIPSTRAHLFRASA